MKFNNVHEVKKWLRNIPILKKEAELKIEFYRDLEKCNTPDWCKGSEYYSSQIECINKKLKTMLEDVDRLFALLDENERLIMTARYINMIRWDFMEFRVYYSRRQAIRIHDRAIEKLVGQTVRD